MTKPPISYAIRTKSVDLKTTATGNIWVRYYFIKKVVRFCMCYGVSVSV